MERRLSAILAADVVGYSRLMGLDETSTLASLKAHQQAVIDPKIAEEPPAPMSSPAAAEQAELLRNKATNCPSLASQARDQANRAA